MNITIQGYPFAADDEVVLGHHDFDSVVATFHMLRERKGLKINYVHVPLHPASDGEIVDLYRRAITPKTRVILVTHVIHTTGQILPVRKIAQMAREHDVDIMVDAAHSFAHIDCQLSDLGSDFVAVNLHKWLGAPLGTGLLYIAKHRVKDIAPLYGDAAYEPESINRLGHFGAIPTAPILAISDAIDFHNSIGGRNKEARLRYLRARWMDNVKDLRHVELLTPLAPERACAIGAFRIKNMSSKDVVEHLLSVHRIFTVERTIDGGRGVRVTPHLYNTIDDIDRLTRALQLLM